MTEPTLAEARNRLRNLLKCYPDAQPGSWPDDVRLLLLALDRAAEALGPFAIKHAYVIANNGDLIPEAWVEERWKHYGSASAIHAELTQEGGK